MWKNRNAKAMFWGKNDYSMRCKKTKLGIRCTEPKKQSKEYQGGCQISELIRFRKSWRRRRCVDIAREDVKRGRW